jgi:uncharacterized protein YidB (DUF937 family)
VAKKMKRMTKEELRQPDEVQIKLQGLWNWLEAHWRLCVYGAGALVAVGLGSTVMDGQALSAAHAEADALADAVAPLTAPIGEAIPGAEIDPDQVRYETRALAVEAAHASIQGYVATNPEALSAEALGVLAPAIAAQAGDAAGAASALTTWVGAHPNSSLQASALHALAEARAGSGDRAGALEAYRQLAAMSQGAIKALAFMAMGDLQNPISVADGDRTKARIAYEEATQALGHRPELPPGDIYAAISEPYLYAEIENRLSLLK